MRQWFGMVMPTVVRNERGAAAIEYGLLAALVGVALFAGAQALGVSLNNLFQGVATFLTGVTPPGGAS